MNRIGIIILIVGIVLAGYGVKEEQHIKTKDIATQKCLSCLGLVPEGVGELELIWLEELNFKLERTNHEVELIVFSAEWCKACPQAIETVKEIAKSSERIEYRVIKHEEEPEEFENFAVDQNGLPLTIIVIDGKEIDRLESAFKLSSRILEAIEKFTEE